MDGLKIGFWLAEDSCVCATRLNCSPERWNQNRLDYVTSVGVGVEETHLSGRVSWRVLLKVNLFITRWQIKGNQNFLKLTCLVLRYNYEYTLRVRKGWLYFLFSMKNKNTTESNDQRIGTQCLNKSLIAALLQPHSQTAVQGRKQTWGCGEFLFSALGKATRSVQFLTRGQCDPTESLFAHTLLM